MSDECILVPRKAPEWLKRLSFQDELFGFCRDDNYAALYEALIEMVQMPEEDVEGYWDDSSLGKTMEEPIG